MRISRTWLIAVAIVLSEQCAGLFNEHTLQFGGSYILIAFDACLNTFDNTQGGLHTYIGSDQRLFKVVEHIIVDGRTACNGVTNLAQDRGIGFLQTFV